MAIKIKDSNGKWITLSQDALETPILDLNNNFDSKNVEGALEELAELCKTEQDSEEIRALISQNSGAISGLNKRLTDAESDIADIKENGGGGGGGGVVPTISSTFQDCSIEKGESIEVPIFFTSPSGGDGVAYVNINNIEVDTSNVKQGNNKITVDGVHFRDTINEVSIYVRDRAGIVSNLLSWTVICGGITLSTTFNYEADWTLADDIKMPYKVETAIQGEIILHLTVDENTYEIPSINGQNTYSFKQLGLGLGSHLVSMYATVGAYTSRVISFNLVIVSTNELFLTSMFDQNKEYEYGTVVSLDYRISKDSTENFKVTIKIDDVIKKEQIVKVGSYSWTIPNDIGVGVHSVLIEVVNEFNPSEHTELVLFLKIIQGDYTPIMDYSIGLLCDLNARGKSNLDVSSSIWQDESGNGHNARLINFNFSTNGFINDELVCDNDAYVELPWSPWSDNAKYGSTIDLIYTPINSGVEDARVIDYTFVTDVESQNEVKPFKGIFADIVQTIGASSSSGTQAGKVNLDDENGDIHLTWVLDRENKYFKLYVDGVLSRFMNLTDSGDGVNKEYEDFAHNNYIYLNSTKGENCGTYNIKRFRVYGHALTSDQILQNHLASITDINEQEKQYNFNYKNSTLPIMRLTGDIRNMTHEQTVDMRIQYISPNEEKYGMSFDTGIPNNPVRIQGTSSLQYVRKNYTIFLKDEYGVDMMYNPYGEGSAPDNVFCLKADYVESSHANNTGIAKFVNDCVYDTKLPTQQLNSNFRNTINGFPIRVYMNNEDLGVYNFNYDRYSNKAFGYDTQLFPNILVYEINSNSDTSAGAFYRYGENEDSSANVTELQYYKRDFGLIYGNRTEESDSYTEIKNLVEWVSVAEQDLFRDTISEHFNREYLFRYFLTVLLIGGVDSLGKNCKLFTIDGRIWYPLFYDIDTCLGMDNSGFLTIQPDVEIESGSFNTSGSKLWSKVWNFFNAEIKQEWEYMRKGNFTLENIMSYIYGEQISQIPPKMYNDDAQIKYLDFGTTYVHCCHGSKEHLMRRWLRERIDYVDSMMGYFVSQDDQITIRTNKVGELAFNITTYIPLYFSVKWSNADGGTQTFKINRGESKTFYYTSTTATDQEVILPFAKHIKRLDNLSNLRPSSCILNNAIKLNNIEIHSDRLYNINVTMNRYLKTVDLSDCPSLGTVQATGSILDLSNCKYLKYGDFRNTSLTEIKLNSSGGSLREIYYPNTIQSVQVIKQPLLETLGLPYISSNHIPLDVINDPSNLDRTYGKYIERDGNWCGYLGYIRVTPGKKYILYSDTCTTGMYLYLLKYTAPTETGGKPVLLSERNISGYNNFRDNPQIFVFEDNVYAIRILCTSNHEWHCPDKYGTLVFKEYYATEGLGISSLYAIDIQDCPNIVTLNTDKTHYKEFSSMYLCGNLTLKNSIKDLTEFSTSGFNRLTNLVIEDMPSLENIELKNLIIKGETPTLNYFAVANCPLLENIDFEIENNEETEYEMSFSNEATLNFGALYTLKELSSNTALKGVKNIVVPKNIQKISLRTEDVENTVENLWSSDVCSVTVDGALIRVAHKTNPSYKGLDITGNTIIDTLELQKCVNIEGVLDLAELESLETVNLKGSAMVGVNVPDFANIKTLILPSAIENVILKNQQKLTRVDVDEDNSIESLWVENITSFNPLALLLRCANIEQARFIGLDCTTPYTALDLLMTLKGIKSDGTECPIADAVTGRVSIARCSESQLARYTEAFPLVEFTAVSIVDTLTVTFVDGDDNIIHTMQVVYGATATIPRDIVPTKTSTAQYHFEWTGGWDRQLTAIMSDVTIKATFNNILRYYTIKFMNPETGEEIDSQYLAYGSKPTKPPLPPNLNYWGAIKEVTGDKTYNAQYVPLPTDYTIFNFKDRSDGTVECQLKAVATLPSTVIFPFEYQGKEVSYIYGQNGTTGRSNITEMFIPDCVEKIGVDIFAHCSNLTIEKVRGLLDNESIWKNIDGVSGYWFSNWTGLTHIDIPTCVSTLSAYTFNNCANLKYVNAPSVTTINGAVFTNCSNVDVLAFGSKETPFKNIINFGGTGGSYMVVTTENGQLSDIVHNVPTDQLWKVIAVDYDKRAIKTEAEIYLEVKDEDDDKAILIKHYDNTITSYDCNKIGGNRKGIDFLGIYCFKSHTNLVEVTLTEEIKKLNTECFRDCTALQEINLDYVEHLAMGCFRNTQKMKKFYLPNVKDKFYAYTFYDSGAELIYAPKVQYATEDATFQCNSLRMITLGSQEHPFKEISSGANNGSNGMRYFCFTTENGLYEDIISNISNFTTDIRYSVHKENTRPIITEGFYHFEVADDKFIPILYSDKNITSIDLNNFNGRKAYCLIGRSCFDGCKNLTSIDIPEGVYYIDESAFYSCSSLESVNLPNSLESIKWRAFYNCSKLKGFDASENVTSLAGDVLGNCSSLLYANFPGISVLPYGTFANCKELRVITLGSQTHPFKEISENCIASTTMLSIITMTTENGLQTDVNLNNTTQQTQTHQFTTSNCRAILTQNELYAEVNDGVNNNGAIILKSWDKTITEYDLTNVAGTGRKAIWWLGKNCFSESNLTNIFIPNGVTKILSQAFYNCKKLETITFEENSNLEIMDGQCFMYCSALKGIDIPISCHSLKAEAFRFCGEMEYVNAPGIQEYNIYYGFHGCNKLKMSALGSIEYPVRKIFKTIELNPNNTFIVISTQNGRFEDLKEGELYEGENTNYTSSDAKNMIFTAGTGKCVIGDFEDYIEINDDGENDKAVLTKVKDKTITGYDLTNIAGTGRKAIGYIGNSCFSGSNLKNIFIPNGVTKILTRAFYDCKSLETITFEENSNLETIDTWGFYGCYTLKGIDLPISCHSLGAEAFRYCHALKYINMPGVQNLKISNCFTNNSMIMASVGSKQYPVEAYNISCGLVDFCSVVTFTTRNGNFEDWGDGDNTDVTPSYGLFYRMIFTTDDTKCVMTDTESYIEMNDGIENDKAILAKVNDKTITEYDLTNIAGTGRKACKKIGSVFSGFKVLSNVVMSDYIEEFDTTFKDCVGLTEISLPRSPHRLRADVFNSCSKLTKVNNSEYTTYVGARTFVGCQIKTLNLPNVSEIGQNAFVGIQYLSVGSENCPVTKNSNTYGFTGGVFAFAIIVTEDKDALTEGGKVLPPDTKAYFPSKGTYCMKETDLEVYAEINDGINNDKAMLIKVKDKDITSYNFNNIADTGRKLSVLIGCDCFRNSKIQSANIPEGVEFIYEGAFARSGLTSLTLPSTLLRIQNYAFEYIGTLTEVTLPSGLQTFNDAFKSSGITTINIPSGITSIANNAFRECTKLKSVTGGENVTSVGATAFYFAPIEFINLPKCATLGNNAFQTNMGSQAQYTFGSPGYPVVSIGSQCFIASSPTVTLYTVTGDETALTGSPWGSSGTFIYELA